MKLHFGDTPDHGENLCLSCQYSSRRNGYTLGEREVWCGVFTRGDKSPVPFPVSDCSAYRKAGQPYEDDYRQIGWVYITGEGFLPPDALRGQMIVAGIQRKHERRLRRLVGTVRRWLGY